MIEKYRFPFRGLDRSPRSSVLFRTAGTYLWRVPKSARLIGIILQGGGSGGAGGLAGAAGSNRGGSGGGASGGSVRLFFRASVLPNNLRFTVGAGGIGSDSATVGNPGGVTIVSGTEFSQTLLSVNGGQAAAVGTAAGGGTGGAGGAAPTANVWTIGAIISKLVVGSPGGNGGALNAAGNAPAANASLALAGGGGGSATSTNSTNGGAGTANMDFEIPAAGLGSVGGPGGDGAPGYFFTNGYLMGCGGAGGGGSNNGVGGNGGNGAGGGGGGGGGAGTTGGRGGDGGDGFAYVLAF